MDAVGLLIVGEGNARRTVERDRAADAALTAAGWLVVRIWEHVPLTDAVAAVTAALDGER